MIRAKRLIKDYGFLRAVDGVDFEVKRGEVLGFLGPNGAGKSTTMKMLSGFLPPTSGTATIDGHDIRENPVAAKSLLGYLPERGPLYPEMTVLELLAFVAELRGISRQAREQAIQRVTQICHLKDVLFQTIDTLSKGYRQRVGMAQAVIHEPSYLIMDEPTDGLDPNQKQAVRQLIASMAEDKAIILSTHILEEVEAMCNRIIIIANGKIIADDTPQKLLQRHPRYSAVHLAVEEIPIPKMKDIITELDSVNKVETDGKGIIAFTKDRDHLRKTLGGLACERNWSINKLENASVSLEEIFHELTHSSPTS